jgi:hypothetical protein
MLKKTDQSLISFTMMNQDRFRKAMQKKTWAIWFEGLDSEWTNPSYLRT